MNGVPPDRSPSVAPGRDERAHRRSSLIACACRRLPRPIGLEPVAQAGIRHGEHGDGEKRRVDRPRFADGEGGDRDAPRHLHDRIERIEPLQLAAGDRHAEDGNGRLRSQHPGQVRGAAGAGDDRLQATRCSALGIGEHCVRHAVRRDDARFVPDAELGENLGGGAERFPVTAGAHDHADHRGVAAHGGSPSCGTSLEL
jgi:hypothetical protein